MAKYWSIECKLMPGDGPRMPFMGLPSFSTIINAGVHTVVGIDLMLKIFSTYAISCKYNPPYVFEFFIVSVVALLLLLGTLLFAKKL